MKCPFTTDKYGIRQNCSGNCVMYEENSCLIREYLAAGLTRERQSRQMEKHAEDMRHWRNDKEKYY